MLKLGVVLNSYILLARKEFNKWAKILRAKNVGKEFANVKMGSTLRAFLRKQEADWNNISTRFLKLAIGSQMHNMKTTTTSS